MKSEHRGVLPSEAGFPAVCSEPPSMAPLRTGPRWTDSEGREEGLGDGGVKMMVHVLKPLVAAGVFGVEVCGLQS